MDVEYPSWLTTLLRYLSFFNLNVDVTAPECIFPDLDFTTKWKWTMASPLLFLAVMALLWMTAFTIKLALEKCFRCGSGRKNGLHGMRHYASHSSQIIAMTISGIYFLYIVVTRRAFEVFDCNPVGNDGYLYTTFTSKLCYGGLCKCYDSVENTQLNMVGWAALSIIFITIGFPLCIHYCTQT